MKYHWNKEEILKNLSYLESKMRECESDQDKIDCLSGMHNYLSMYLIRASKYNKVIGFYTDSSSDLDTYRTTLKNLKKVEKKQDRVDRRLYRKEHSEYFSRFLDREPYYEELFHGAKSILSPVYIYEIRRNLADEEIFASALLFLSQLDNDLRKSLFCHLTDGNRVHFCKNIYQEKTSNIEGINFYDSIQNKSYSAIVNENNYSTASILIHEAIHALYYEKNQDHLPFNQQLMEVSSIAMAGAFCHEKKKESGLPLDYKGSYLPELRKIKKIVTNIDKQSTSSNANTLISRLELSQQYQELECRLLGQYYMEQMIKYPDAKSEILRKLIFQIEGEYGIPDYKKLGVTGQEIITYTKKIEKSAQYF